MQPDTNLSTIFIEPIDILQSARLPQDYPLPPTVPIVSDDYFEEDAQLTDRALDILQNIRKHWDSPYVFYKADGARYWRFTRGLAGAVRRAEIPHLKWHDLRRTCGCRLLQEYKVDIIKVSKWLGHASVMVERGDVADAVQEISESDQIRSTFL